MTIGERGFLPVVTAEEMRALDARTIGELGVPGVVLMELAGHGAAKFLWREAGLRRGDTVAVLAGGGNNGGDGFVIARHLAHWGAQVAVYLLAPVDKVGGDARINLEIWQRMGGILFECADAGALSSLREGLSQAVCIVDAILGTGLSSKLRGVVAEAVSLINCLSPKVVLAVDIPTGISSDSGQAMPDAVRADLTVTFGCLKRGLVLYPGAGFAGKTEVVDIGIPPAFVRDLGLKVYLLHSGVVSAALPRREPDSHKGTFGHVLVVAGSGDSPGAAVLAARAAIRGGAGLVTLASHPRACAAAISSMPEMMIRELHAGDWEALPALVEGKTALVVGPGLGTGEGVEAMVRYLAMEVAVPMVLDADALNVLAAQADGLASLKGAPGSRLLTPHPKEMSRLLGLPVVDILADRIGAARTLAHRTGAHVLFKGARTLIVGPDGSVLVNTTGGPALATGGTGDVLSGLIGALLAQGGSPQMVLAASAHIHGVAGELACDELGEVGVTAGDVERMLPRAIDRCLRSEARRSSWMDHGMPQESVGKTPFDD